MVFNLVWGPVIIRRTVVSKMLALIGTDYAEDIIQNTFNHNATTILWAIFDLY